MKVTVFGAPGTGTSTVCKLISEKLNLHYGYTGQIFRDTAKSLGYTIYEFDKLQRKNPQYDRELDSRVAEFGKSNDNFIFEGRLAWHFISDSIKIKFVCDEREAARRVAKREEVDIDEAYSKTQKREEDIKARYKLCYPNLEYPPLDDKFDFIIDTTDIGPEEVAQKIIEFLSK